MREFIEGLSMTGMIDSFGVSVEYLLCKLERCFAARLSSRRFGQLLGTGNFTAGFGKRLLLNSLL